MPLSLRFIKRIQTEKNSIFYSLLPITNRTFIGFGRKNCPARIIKKVLLDEKFDIIEDHDETFRGEDPRCFYFNNTIYVVDNYFNDMYLIQYKGNAAKTFTRIQISGKNLSFIPHNGTLYFIHYMKPFQLCTCNVETGECAPVEVGNHQNTIDYEYRGGTPGYLVAGTNNQYFGYGHRTYVADGILTHDIHKWIVTFPWNGEPPTIEYVEVPQPLGSNTICDPTSVVDLNGRLYLITAETDDSWFHEPDFITNVYEIVEWG